MGPIPRGRRSGYTSQRPAKNMQGRAWNKRSPKRKGRVYMDSTPDLAAEYMAGPGVPISDADMELLDRTLRDQAEE